MTRSITAFTVVVPDYDLGIAFYRGALGFELLEDRRLSDTKRWVRLGPGDEGCALLLAEADDDAQRARIGDQTGGRVMGFLSTDSFVDDHARMLEHGVRFLEVPRHESYGIVAVFEDPWGNRWDLIQPAD
ncbi:MAG TPA: VOC family protein [Pseudomonadales bacterium]|nr:VOC family protein [Pseudomonadales bacterium]